MDNFLLEKQRQILSNACTKSFVSPPLLQKYHRASEEDTQRGEALIRRGKVGCLLLAGGSGSRLKWKGPKGCFPLASVQNKTLFQLFLEKSAALSLFYGQSLPIAIMTSVQNFEATERYLKENRWFGVDEEQISLFIQEEMPYLDEQGNWIKNSSGTLLTGPDGNGYALRGLARSQIARQWKERGISHVNVIPIDNPLANPFDAALCGFCDCKELDVAIKSVLRQSPDEKVGVLVEGDEGVRIIEYMELNTSLKTDDFAMANIGLFCFHIDFVLKAHEIELPWHVVRKTLTVDGKEMLVWKFETFLFDILEHTRKVDTLLYPRESTFAPLKDGSEDLSSQRILTRTAKEG